MKKILVFIMSLCINSIFGHIASAVPGECDDVQCVIFEVTVHLNSYHETPLSHRTTHVISIDGASGNYYDSVVERAGDTCTKQVRVPLSVYEMVTNVVASIGGSGGQPLPVLTPSQQTILLLYTTLSQQTIGFTCSPRDLGQSSTGSGGTAQPGSGTAEPFGYYGRVSGIVGFDGGRRFLMVEENGVSRQVSVGGYLLGGWQVREIRNNEALLRRGQQQAVVPVGGRY